MPHSKRGHKLFAALLCCSMLGSALAPATYGEELWTSQVGEDSDIFTDGADHTGEVSGIADESMTGMSQTEIFGAEVEPENAAFAVPVLLFACSMVK